jgi:hypothetical protein
MTIQYDGSRRSYREHSPETKRHSDELVCVAVALFALLLVGLLDHGGRGSDTGLWIASANGLEQLMLVF